MKEKQAELPGMPAKPARAEKFGELETAIHDLAEILSRFDIPDGSQVKIDRKIQGDVLSVVYKPGA